jgi:hypothetical protein
MPSADDITAPKGGWSAFIKNAIKGGNDTFEGYIKSIINKTYITSQVDDTYAKKDAYASKSHTHGAGTLKAGSTNVTGETGGPR